MMTISVNRRRHTSSTINDNFIHGINWTSTLISFDQGYETREPAPGQGGTPQGINHDQQIQIKTWIQGGAPQGIINTALQKYTGAPIQDLEFGTFLKNAPQRQNLGLWTKLGLFWDHFYTLLGLLVVIFIKMPQNLQKAKKALKTV